ncbi:GGDEF domain-containing protein [Bacillus coahuilensis]|uniref:GGDEF domain-containing protein n=1 Tax=Bacillus coahuilensis TaxID=408580 RepID=UPI0001851499|nr:GGDEF domain-containing protein [Bacillus coahuilensis]
MRVKTFEHGYIWCDIQGTPVYEEHVFKHIILTSRDVTQQVKYEEELKQLAFYDELTGLPNRRLFVDRAEHNLARCERNHLKFALLFLDGDGFKSINDQYGHDVGDEFLKECAARLKNVVRKEDTISRFGGDEFVILLTSVDNEDEIEEAATRYVSTMDKPLIIKGNEIQATFSVGISVFPKNGSTIEELMKQADEALYMAKERGKNQFVFYNEW